MAAGPKHSSYDVNAIGVTLPEARTGRAPAAADQDLRHRAARTLFRVHNFNDIHERTSEVGLRLPLGKKRSERLNIIRRSGTLFVHVPKNAGTSINTLLYGCTMRHESARYYRSAAPDLFNAQTVRFAIWRDPVQRFLSAYDFARQGGGRNVRMHPHFAAIYRHFRSLDDAIEHVANARSYYDLDHVFRPQSWYLTGRDGRLLVDRLFAFEHLDTLPDHIPALAGCTIPHLNESCRTTHAVTAAQAARIRRIYAPDEALRERLMAG